MIEGPIKQDETFRHIKTGNEYVVIMGNHNGDEDTKTIIKLPGGEWSDELGVIVYYNPLISNKNFVRLETDFRSHFERIA